MFITETRSLLPSGQFRFNWFGHALLGKGGLGIVHRIRIIESNCEGLPVGSDWAAKRLNERWVAHPQMRERFEREIAALKMMSHRNIIACHGESLPVGERFYVMPLFQHSLRSHIAAGGLRGQWRQIAILGAELADAMAYAHGLGFIHRDFKPDNILFNNRGPLVIADWGLGYFVHRHSVVLQQLTVGGMGTAYYCCAQQWATGKCDQTGDIYSLGMTLDEWVTGGQRRIQVGGGIGMAMPAGSLTAGAQRFNALLQFMTQSASSDRPQSMSWVAGELRLVATMV